MMITQGSALWQQSVVLLGLGWNGRAGNSPISCSEVRLCCRFSSAGGASPGVGCFLKHGMISFIFCCGAGEPLAQVLQRGCGPSAFGDTQIPGVLSIPPCLRLVLSRRFLNGL